MGRAAAGLGREFYGGELPLGAVADEAERLRRAALAERGGDDGADGFAVGSGAKLHRTIGGGGGGGLDVEGGLALVQPLLDVGGAGDQELTELGLGDGGARAAG